MNRFPLDKILLLDGAMGTMIQGLGLKEEHFHSGPFADVQKDLKGNNECLNLTHPELIEGIHLAYIEAGADIIETNSFSANSISQKEYDCAEYSAQMAAEAARIAVGAVAKSGRRVLVAGSVGPTSKSLSMSPDMADATARSYSFDQMAEAYKEQIDALISGGVDFLLIETAFDALNVKAALYAAGGFPAVVSVSASDRSGRTLTGQTLKAFYDSVSHYNLLGFGLNCSLGAAELLPLVKEVASFSDVPVFCYPNAGMPNEMGEYSQAPEEMADCVFQMAKEGLVDVVGGCCGSTDKHIAAISSRVSSCTARRACLIDKSTPLMVSGLESHIIDKAVSNFVNIGERTNVAGSRKFARLIAEGQYDTALQIAADQIENGASIIDINMDDAMLDSTKEMQNFLRHISGDPAVAKAALMIDSSHWDTIVAGLKNTQGKSIVNSISLKEGEEEFIRKATEIHRLGAAMVIMAFDQEGQATTYERKIEICQRAYNLLTQKAGIPAKDIIFDCNILSIGTGIDEHRRYAVDFIEAVRWIKQNLPGAYTSGGVSNLSFAFRGNNAVREAMHSAFLYHAIEAGLDMAIVNPSMLQVYDSIEPELLQCVEDVIFDRDDEATERLIAKAERLLALKAAPVQGQEAAQSDKVAASPEDSLIEALVKGKTENIEKDVLACLEIYGTAVKVIEGPLMAGMEKVGELFGAGKMFLPQVVKSSKVMRDCVSVLEPYMAASEGESSRTKPKVVIATVKGDVHDIGKNITAIVLGCNGFDVIDLGVMVDKETILEAAQKHNADIIAVSGLITPSLFQMEEICREMASRNMDTPLFVGGATTSRLHTAVKLAPLYEHVYHGADASASAILAKRCLMDKERFEEEERAGLKSLRATYEKKDRASAGPSRQNHYEKASYLETGAYSFKDVPACEIGLSEVLPFFDWRSFLAIWGIKYAKVDIESPEIQKIIAEAKAELAEMQEAGTCRISYALKFYEAYNQDDVIVTTTGEHFPMMRQEQSSVEGGCLYSLADYVPDKDYDTTTPMGLFAISVRSEHPIGCTCCRSSSEHPASGMLTRTLRLALAEAASAWLDSQLAAPLSATARVVKPAAGYACCPDHSLKKDILALLPDADKLGISLTESYAMLPDASICGFVFFHPEAGYPEIRRISQAQYDRYLKLRNMSPEEGQRLLGNLL